MRRHHDRSKYKVTVVYFSSTYKVISDLTGIQDSEGRRLFLFAHYTMV